MRKRDRYLFLLLVFKYLSLWGPNPDGFFTNREVDYIAKVSF